jgi:hypothetical protein
MPAALLAILLLAATVDARLAEPLRPLAEVGARDTADGHVGQFFADLPDSLGLTEGVGELPHGAVGRYDSRTRTVTIVDSVVAEDPRVVAVMLAHELQHALDRKRVALDLLDADCLALEVRGFEAQAHVTRLFWPDDLPAGTDLERHLAAVVWDVERDGSAGIAAALAGDAAYRRAPRGGKQSA